MKFTKESLNILRNFSQINQGIHFKSGNIVRTKAAGGTLFAETTLPENVPSDFTIYNLGQFLEAHNLFNDPEVSFESQKLVKIHEPGKEVVYIGCDLNMITAASYDKSPKQYEPEVVVDVKKDVLESALKAASVLGLKYIGFAVNKHGSVELKVFDSENPSENTFSQDLGVKTDKTGLFKFKVENFKVLPGTYRVELNEKSGKFQNQDLPVNYFIAQDTK